MKGKYIITVFLVFVLAFAGCRGVYTTRAECIQDRLNGKDTVLEIVGEDSDLIYYKSVTGDDTEVHNAIITEVNGGWEFHKINPLNKREHFAFYFDGSIVCYWDHVANSADKYIIITSGPITEKEESSEDIESWVVKDSLGSSFQKLDIEIQGVDKVFFIACIPSDTREYSLQIDKWIIRDVDLNQPWNKTKAKVELVEEVGGLS